MFVEAEIPMLMLIGFIVVMAVYGMFVVKYVRKTSGDALWLFVVQIILLVIAFSQIYMMLGRGSTAMTSELNSFNLAVAGISWALSMAALVLGIKKLTDE